MKYRRQLHAIRRAGGASSEALSSVYEQSPAASRRLTNHSTRGLWPAATVQTRRTAQAAANRPRAVERTMTCCHTVWGGRARARTSCGR